MACADRTQHKLTIVIDPITAPPSSSATNARECFFMIRTNYVNLSASAHHPPPPAAATWLTRVVVEPRSEFLSNSLPVVRQLFAGMGVTLPDEVLSSFVPGLTQFFQQLTADPVAASQNVLRIQLDLTALNSSRSDADIDRAVAELVARTEAMAINAQ